MAINYKQSSTASMYDQITGAYLGNLGLQGQTTSAGVFAPDLNGNTLGIVGLQNGGRKPLRVIPLGTSVTAGNSTSPVAGVWNFGGTSTELPVMLAGRQFSLVRNAGVPGNTSAQVLARIQTDCLAYYPDIVLLEMLTNDLPAMQANFATGCIQPLKNLQSAVIQVLAAGALPIIVTPPPHNVNSTATMRIQWFCYDIARLYGIPLIDMFRTMADPAAQGSYLAGNSTDFVHPNSTGIALMAQMSSVLQNLTPCSPYTCAVTQTGITEQSNLIRNGNFAGGNSGWGVNTTNAVVTNPVATFPNTGTNFNYVKSDAAGVYAISGATPTLIDSNVYEFTGGITVSGLTPITTNGFNVALETSGVNARPFNSFKQNGTYAFDYLFTVPVGKGGGWTPNVYVSDAATFVVNNLTLVNVTAQRAIYNCGWTTYPTI